MKTSGMSAYTIAETFGAAYVRAQTAQTAISGFRATGIWPLNRNIFPPEKFVAASGKYEDQLYQVLDIVSI